MHHWKVGLHAQPINSTPSGHYVLSVTSSRRTTCNARKEVSVCRIDFIEILHSGPYFALQRMRAPSHKLPENRVPACLRSTLTGPHRSRVGIDFLRGKQTLKSKLRGMATRAWKSGFMSQSSQKQPKRRSDKKRILEPGITSIAAETLCLLLRKSQPRIRHDGTDVGQKDQQQVSRTNYHPASLH